MYESRRVEPIARRHFLRRLAGHIGAAMALVFLSLFIGMAGYRWLEGLTWRDAFLNAAMLLAGEGPVTPPHTPDGKVFAGFYAMYCGLVFLGVVALVLAPIVHRILHKFHWSEG
jgi:NhaP-type Na+/H+ or K+/H+ antiporter